MSDAQLNDKNLQQMLTGGLDLPVVTMVGLVTTVVTVVTIIAAQAVYFASIQRGLENNQYRQRDAALTAYHEEQGAMLADSVWTSLDKSTASIPIDLAIQEYAKQVGGE
ncbi:MAG: hypothetical protein ACYTGQ_20170 [Planctomycetota bacterium]|jgi:hypothetical protein